MRLAGRTFTNPAGRWMKVEMIVGNTIWYNVSGAVQWVCGRLMCSRGKFKKMIQDGQYSTTSKP